MTPVITPEQLQGQPTDPCILAGQRKPKDMYLEDGQRQSGKELK